MFGELFSGLAEGLLVVGKTSAPLLLSGLVMKHGKKATGWIPNDIIPVANGILGVGIGWATTGDPQAGAMLGISAAAGATGTHQILKMGIRKLFPKFSI